MTLTKNQLHILRHSIGLDDSGHVKYGYDHSDRNHYCTGPGCDGRADIMELESAGLMKFSHHINEGRDEIFYVTEAGIVQARAWVAHPKTTRGQRRYRAFLHADCGLTFIEWLKSKWGRECT